MGECGQNCSECSKECSERQDFSVKLNELSKVKKVIAVVSGKGGVGKSLVTSMLAVLERRKGYNTAILDADITGPSIPKMFGVYDRAEVIDEKYLVPVKSKTGIEIMSINLLLPSENDPVVWRGPVIGGTVKQFWSDVVWNDVDFMFVDMPPGTGDVPLTVFQSLPVSGIIVVTSPQDLVSMIVGKAVKMAEMMNIPVLGIVENMSYYECPRCKEKIKIFGDSHVEVKAKEYGIDLVAKIPVNTEFAAQSDRGIIELFEGDFLNEIANRIEKLL